MATLRYEFRVFPCMTRKNSVNAHLHVHAFVMNELFVFLNLRFYQLIILYEISIVLEILKQKIVFFHLHIFLINFQINIDTLYS